MDLSNRLESVALHVLICLQNFEDGLDQDMMDELMILSDIYTELDLEPTAEWIREIHAHIVKSDSSADSLVWLIEQRFNLV